MTDKVQIAAKQPAMVDLKAGKKYFWCACGRSAKQPFCDGSHKVTDITPVAFVAEEDKSVFLCCCKHSGNKPFCDGTHGKL